MISSQEKLDDFCVTHLTTRLFINRDGQRNEISLGSAQNYFAAMIHGSARLIPMGGGEEIDLQEGDLLYIPRGLRYTSVWYGDPDCRFLSVGFDFSSLAQNGQYSLQVIHCTNCSPRALLDKIHRAPTPADALSRFFALWARFSPLLSPAEDDARRSEILPAIRRLESDGSYDFSVPELADLCAMSETSFYRTFRAVTGYTPVGYKNLLRCRRAIEYLTETDLPLDAIAERLDCCTPAYLRRLLLSETGKSPREIRRSPFAI